MIKVGVVGGTGYTGVELLRLLAQHPEVEIKAITSRGEAGMPVADLFPSLRKRVDLCFVDPQAADLASCDVVFFATPHGVAMAQAPELLAAGVKVVVRARKNADGSLTANSVSAGKNGITPPM